MSRGSVDSYLFLSLLTYFPPHRRYLKDCRSLKPAILTDAIKTGRLPKVKRLEALWRKWSDSGPVKPTLSAPSVELTGSPLLQPSLISSRKSTLPCVQHAMVCKTILHESVPEGTTDEAPAIPFAENGIAMSEAMTTFYAPYVSEKVMDAEQANKIVRALPLKPRFSSNGQTLWMYPLVSLLTLYSRLTAR